MLGLKAHSLFSRTEINNNAILPCKHFTMGKGNVVFPTFQMTKLSFSDVCILCFCKKMDLRSAGFECLF